MTAKYVRTKNNEIIVFSELLVHSNFKRFEPVSAGFIAFKKDDKDGLTCECYGQSISLDFLQSKPEEDSKLAKRQILGIY
jgi:hypothetical protein